MWVTFHFLVPLRVAGPFCTGGGAMPSNEAGMHKLAILGPIHIQARESITTQLLQRCTFKIVIPAPTLLTTTSYALHATLYDPIHITFPHPNMNAIYPTLRFHQHSSGKRTRYRAPQSTLSHAEASDYGMVAPTFIWQALQIPCTPQSTLSHAKASDYDRLLKHLLTHVILVI